GWLIVATFEDAGISGAKGRDDRPGLDRLLKDATRGRFNVVLAWSVDRLGRSLIDLLACLQELHSARVDLFLHKQAVGNTPPGGKAMLQMMGVFAEFERAMIQDRVRAGIARARMHGTKSGRGFGRPPVATSKMAEIQRLLEAKQMGTIKIAKTVGVGVGT